MPSTLFKSDRRCLFLPKDKSLSGNLAKTGEMVPWEAKYFGSCWCGFWWGESLQETGVCPTACHDANSRGSVVFTLSLRQHFHSLSKLVVFGRTRIWPEGSRSSPATRRRRTWIHRVSHSSQWTKNWRYSCFQIHQTPSKKWCGDWRRQIHKFNKFKFKRKMEN